MTPENSLKELDEIITEFENTRKPLTFYRVCNPESEQGLWYDYKGNFTGLIHDRFKFCKNHELRMDFDDELVGWLSAVGELDDLYHWFTVEEIKQLQEFRRYIHEYEVDNFRI